ncbi:flagellar export chaperone FlgN [Alteromonas mediterranea]|uniref:Flagellar biosynthesis protein FlgN n=1 Tax=Alteromonas mediterranea TaxID=314275 RepID=A0AAC8XI36_9ALTE|nr:flagellar export chaperone FlgN [Alteromonas mediterranea]MBR9896739.1 flagellar protein FlgN [Gammaproteobacteria bacterium]MDY6884900.1 flagellar export chaperone FlgN [Pseudomonadota bacterium]AFV84524.1 putative flagellar protein FlgN [Alteromonas mediterranea DE1]AGP80936.1 flagellar protein FlgN [Alteromonas mediterranea MED64]AGP96532.1 flagellar protein FlgN [Alteromonas mediterranea UM7]
MTEQNSPLSQAIAKQVEQLSTLVALLEKELQLISSRDAESLMKVLDEKTQLLTSIQTLDSDIERTLAGSASLSQYDEDLMEQAKRLLDDCKYRTQVNQKAVEQGQLRLTHLRNLMMEVRAKESLTYDKKGKPKGGTLGSGVSA